MTAFKNKEMKHMLQHEDWIESDCNGGVLAGIVDDLKKMFFK